MNSTKLMLSIHIGNESTMCGYAYVDGNGELQYGVLENSAANMSHYPASALYVEASDSWVYGPSAEGNVDTTTFTNIAGLLRLLGTVGQDDSQQCQHYTSHNSFFKFGFANLAGNRMMADTDSQYLFTANVTPQAVCEQYCKDMFANFIAPAVGQLINSNGLGMCDIQFMPVYPAGASEQYIVELERLVKVSCGEPNCYGDSVSCVGMCQYAISSTKATAGYFASTEGAVAGRSVVVADISTTQVAVSAVSYGSEGMIIDGADSHSNPANIVNKEYCDAVSSLVCHAVDCQHILGGDHAVSGGGMLALPYIASSQFASKLTSDGSAVRRVVQYLANELALHCNENVVCLALAGDGATMHGLTRSLQRVLADKFAGRISILLPVLSEDVHCAAAIGGAILATGHYTYKMCAPLSYGSWSTIRDSKNGGKLKYCLDIMISKGDEFEPEGGLIKNPYTIHCSSAGLPLEFFSANTTKAIEIGESGSAIRSALEGDATIALRCIYDARIKLLKGGEPVSVERFDYVETFNYDRDGRVTIEIVAASGASSADNDIEVSIVANN